MAKQSVCSGQHTPDHRLFRQFQLVDYTVAITEVGYKAQMMNAFFNIKTAEKGLQFGIKKCKSMLIGKNNETVINSNPMVDKWSVDG